MFVKRFSGLKSPFDYETCKYEDIKPKSIIHQGYLQYLYSTNILGDSLCKFDFWERCNSSRDEFVFSQKTGLS